MKLIQPLLKSGYLFFNRLIYSFFNADQMRDVWNQPPQASGVIWLHAASAGELESLWSLADQYASQGESLVLTTFSQSGLKKIQQLALELKKNHGVTSVVFSGISPFENQWEKAISALSPKLFITIKYEAWPALYASLAKKNIHLVILGARFRKSLKWGFLLTRLLFKQAPEWSAFSFTEEDQKSLFVQLPKEFFPKNTQIIPDPRVHRIFIRNEKGESSLKAEQKAKELLVTYPKPWGVIASAWPEDLSVIFNPSTENFYQTGSLFIFPHDLSESSKEVFTHQHYPKNTHIIFEMGFLTEFFKYCDWAYVGGGFGKGVHSVLEPAIHGIPISCGPNRPSQWTEVQLLQRLNQIQVIQNSEEFLEWFKMKNNTQHNIESLKTYWLAQKNRFFEVYQSLKGMIT